MSKRNVLIAEDDESLRALLERFLSGKGHTTVAVADGIQALARIRQQLFDVALVDINMPGLDGLEVLRQMRNEADPPEVVIMTGEGTVDTAITAVKLGAYDYVTKPYRMEEIEVAVQKAGEKRDLARENARLQTELEKVVLEERVVSRDPRILAIVDRIPEIADSRLPVLIVGERGTGKDVFVRAIHAGSGSGNKCLYVDADGPSEYDVDSALFGHEAGSHPGVIHARPGAFEAAGMGTVVLSNAHALSQALQDKLLHTLFSGRFVRAGGDDQIRANARLIATSSRDLSVAVSEGKFSPALLAELSAHVIHLPPLRERQGDVVLLANYFLERMSGSATAVFDAEAIAALSQYSWPGNVIELRNAVERVAMLRTGDVIGKQDLPLPGVISSNTPSSIPLAELERQHIQAVLAETNWHQGNAAAKLGISSKTLYRKIREYGFVRPRDQQGG